MPPSEPRLPEAALSPAAIHASGLCIGCGACASREPRAAMRLGEDGFLHPQGPDEWFGGADPEFARICPFSPGAANEDQLAAARFPAAPEADPWIGRHESTWVGHAEDPFRAEGSSGGMANWIAAELLRTGAVDGVAHVVPTHPATGRLFAYAVSRSLADLTRGGKSRYYPIELTEILREIRAVPGRYALVGIPCFIKAINLARAAEPVLAERIRFTIGLFCGHMKSARLVDSFAHQLGLRPAEVMGIDYRRNAPERPANWYTAEITASDGSTRRQDWWHLAEGDWGSGFFMHSACNFCDDVAAETADVSLGDAWLEPYSSDGRGTNVVVVRSPEIGRLIARGVVEKRLSLTPVDADFVHRTQAAGFRQRREGLAWRLAKARLGVMPVKRVTPSRELAPRRREIYRARMTISRWSIRLWSFAQRIGWPGYYYLWARLALKVYAALAWSRGRLGRALDRYFANAGEG